MNDVLHAVAKAQCEAIGTANTIPLDQCDLVQEVLEEIAKHAGKRITPALP